MTPRGEFEWIARLADVLGVAADARGGSGIGDDAAILAGGTVPWAWTIDTLVEGVHFRFDWLDSEDVGHRALVASLSDLAAMGAEPAGALVSVAGSAPTIAAELEGIYRGLAALAGRTACPVLGGDLSRAGGPLHLTVTALGRCPGAPLLRSGVRPGDELWVTGSLGGPAAAIALLEAGVPVGTVRQEAAYRRLARPEARNAEVGWLQARAPLRGAIDLSDGLSSDAAHLASRSQVAIAIEAERVPVHSGAADCARLQGADPLEWALHGGEEFELLLSAPDGALAPHAGPFAAAFGIPLTRIGSAAAGEGVTLVRKGVPAPLESRGWDHFPGT